MLNPLGLSGEPGLSRFPRDFLSGNHYGVERVVFADNRKGGSDIESFPPLCFYVWFFLERKLALEEVLYCLIGYHLLVERVGTVLRVLHHLDNLCIGTSVALTSTERSHYFLCHCLES